jgi:MoxR-like ATPase
MNTRQNLVATLVAALTAAPLCGHAAPFAELPVTSVVRPLELKLAPVIALPTAQALRVGATPSIPGASQLPGAVVLTMPLPAAAIPAIPAMPAAASAAGPRAPASGPKALAQDFGRVQKAMAAMPDANKGGDSASRQSGEDLEKAMTGEGAKPSVPADLSANLSPNEAGTKAKQEQVKQAKAVIESILAEVGKVIVGQDEMKRAILMAMIAREHVLLEGLPGVAKTQTAKAFADAVEGAFQRVQGTPDKLPSDILGSEVLQEDPATGKKSFELVKGPIFTNLLLLDEINRMPPKAQAALLEAMAEGHVTIGRQTIKLDRFTVLATQNPVEQDGTYRLPEAQLDRFMLKVLVPQPTAEELKRVMRLNRHKDEKPKAQKVTTLAQLDDMRRLSETLDMNEDVEDYIVRVAMAASQKDLKSTVDYTVYTRASIYLEQAARIHALMRGSAFVTPSDVRAIAPMVLRHRIALSYQAQGTTVEELIQTILDRVTMGAISRAQAPAVQQPRKK